jgi:hypothetical protein
MPRMLVFSLVLLSSACSTGWVLEDSPTKEDLFGVYQLSEVGTFAVGANGTALIRVNNSWWELDTGVSEDLLDVWGAGPNSVYVVGEDCTVLKYNPPAEGKSPGSATFDKLTTSGCGDLFSIEGKNASTIWVAGGGGLYRLRGQSLVAMGSFGTMTGVSLPGGDQSLAVGNKGVVALYASSKWTRQEITTCPVSLVERQCPMEVIRPVLWDAWLSTKGKGVIVGSNGGIWTYPPPAEGPWTSLESDVDGEIKAVHGFENGSQTAYAVGSNGSVVKVQGVKTKHVDIGARENLEGVWASDQGTEVFIVGASGTIAHISR